MKNLTLKSVVKSLFFFVIIFLLFFQGESIGLNPGNGEKDQEQDVKKARLYKDVFPLISETDLYCSFFVMEKVKLDMLIVGSEKEEERILIRENDIFFVNKGSMDGLEIGQIFLILEVGEVVESPVTGKNFGRIVMKRGRGQIVTVEDERAFGRLEKACGQVMVGHYLVPFEEKSELLGTDLGYDDPISEEEGSLGMLIYFQDDYEQISRGHTAIIDIGEEDGIHFGQQLVIYRKTKGKKGIIENIGNLIVIDTQMKTSTVKILSSNTPLRLGDKVQPHFK
jgi:hypothetical protein